jgi:hypothetical protein
MDEGKIVGWLFMTFMFATVYGIQAYNTWYAPDNKLYEIMFYGGWITRNETRESRKFSFKIILVGYFIISAIILFS